MAQKIKAKLAWKPAPLHHGMALDNTHLNASATYQGNPVPGTYKYSHQHGALLPVGRHRGKVRFEPDDKGTYAELEEAIILIVEKGTPIIHWDNPSPIVYGMQLTAAQLNATASYDGNDVSGQFQYTPAGGAVLDAGDNQKLLVTFTPADTDTFETATKAVYIDVEQAPLTVTADNKTKVFGDALPPFTVSYSVFVNADDPTDLGGVLTFSTSAADSPVGSYPIMPAGLTSQNYKITFAPGTLVVTSAPLRVAADSQTKYYGDPLPAFTANYTGRTTGIDLTTLSFTTTPVASASSQPGIYTITPGGLNSPNYNISYVVAALTVVPVAVSGTITSGGQPLAAVQIAASYLPTPPAPFPQGEMATTGTDGKFTLNLMAGQHVRVDFPSSFPFQDQRFQNEKLTVFLRGTKSTYLQTLRGTTPPTLDAVYELRGCRISGQVQRQATGRSFYEPFQNVPVVLRNPTDGTQITGGATDDTGGFCLFTDRGGRMTLEFPREWKDGDDLLSIPDSADHSFDIILSDGLPYPLTAPVVYQLESAEIVGQVTDGTRGLKGIPVSLDYTDGTAYQGKQPIRSNTNGVFAIRDLPPGAVELTFPNLVKDGYGNSWELQSGQSSAQRFTLNVGQVRQATPVAYQPEQHAIQQLVKMGGIPAENVLVEVRLPKGDYALVSRRTGRDGKATLPVPQAGTYEVHVYPDPSATGAKVVNLVEVHSIQPAPDADLGQRSPSGPPPPNGGNGSGDLQSFPILTEEVPQGGMQRPSTTGGGATGTSQLAQTADTAIREVLSWRTKANDPKGFVAALNQAFALKEVEGHTEWAWTPRSYTVQTNMGVVTGAQASIYARAKVALDQALPLLDGLYTLLPTVLQEDLDSIRQVVRSQFTSLVNELGVVGGPRVPRVDQLFQLLLGDPAVTDPEALSSGTLFTLRTRFGLKRSFVTTVEDEQDLTNYLILVDYIIGLNQSWINEKGFFSRNGSTGEPFFGTQLVLLSRSLDVVAQSVRDCYFTMDSVFLGDAERQTISLDFSDLQLIRPLPGELQAFLFPHGTSSLFVAELLDWVDRASSEELPAMLQDSGKDGIPSLTRVVDTIRHFVRGAIIPPQASPSIPSGYRTPRVQRALQELADQLDELFTLASKINAPSFPAFNGRSAT